MENKTKPRVKSPIILFLMVALAVFLVSPSMVYSLGVSPADKTITFKPNTNAEISFNLINSENNDLNVSLSAIGELKDIVFFDKPIIQIKPGEYRTPFRAILKFPAGMEPGMHDVSIKITPIFSPSQSNLMAAYIAPQIPIRVRVPYPFKYAYITLLVFSVDEGTPVPVYVAFDNMGSADIAKAGATVEIYPLGEKEAVVLKTGNISVGRDLFIKTLAQPSPILKKGLYTAIVKAYYDETSRTVESNFSIGEQSIRIRKLVTKEIRPGQINKVTFVIYNEWNTEVDVNGVLRIKGNQNEMPSFKLGKYEEKQVTGYINTSGLELGSHSLNITLAYAGQIRTSTFQITIAEPVIKLPYINTTWLAITLVLLILIIALIIILREKRKVTHRK